MAMVVICENYGWTYQQYMDQPLPFLLLIKERMHIDAKTEEQSAKRAKTNITR